MKKIALLLGRFCTAHRPLDFIDVWNNTRSLTGSELLVVKYCQEFLKLGWEVSMFSCFTHDIDHWDGINVYDISQKDKIIDDTFDCVVSLNEPDDLRSISNKTIKIFSQQLNGFSYCQPSWDEGIDICLSPSTGHLDYHRSMIPNIEKWKVLRDGCDPDVYSFDKKVPGRVLFPSSADRGLHHLLSIWSRVKVKVPFATLRVLYYYQYGKPTIEPTDRQHSWCDRENSNRIRYINHAIGKLKPFGVEMVGSCSRNEMIKEWNEAVVFPFTCDPIGFVEGFSISTLEACASRTVPILSEVDALPSIYGEVVEIIPGRPADRYGQWEDAIVKALMDESHRAVATQKAVEFAQLHRWSDIVKELEELIVQHPKFKK